MKFFLIPTLCGAMALAGCATSKPPPEPEPVVQVLTRSAYNQPLSTPGSRFASLPQPVRNTVLAQAGMAEITDVKKEIVDDRVIYTIFFRDPLIFPPLIVGADGSVLHPDLTVAVPAPQQSVSVNVHDLPLGVSKTLNEKEPSAEISTINREVWGDHTVYVVTFKDDIKHPKLYILAEGTSLVPAK